MKRSHVWVVVSAALLNGWFAHAQEPGLPGYGTQPNPGGVPAPYHPDYKFRPADPFYVPPPMAPPPTGREGMPFGLPQERMQSPYGPPPGGMRYGYPMMGMPPGAQPFGAPMPTPMPGPGQPFGAPMPTPMPGQRFAPPMPTPYNGGGQPYMVPREPSGPDRLPAILPPSPIPVKPPMPAPEEACPAPIPETQPVSYHAPVTPSAPCEPYVLYEGGRCQKGLLDCEVQKGYHVWAGLEYLYWTSKNSSAPPPLATAAPPGAAGVVDGLQAGSIGRADTTIVIGGQPLDVPSRNGARLTLGAWFDPEQTFGLEMNYFFLAARNQSQTATSNGGDTDISLFNPILDVNPDFPGEFSNVLAGFGFGFGSTSLTFTSQLQGAELNTLCHTVDYFGLNVNVLAGFRYLNLWESIQLTTTQRGEVNLGPSQFVNTFDLFKTRNNFYGGQLGLRADYQLHWFFVNTTAKIAYGNMVEAVTIDGRTTTNTGLGFANLVPIETVPGGVYAQPTNIGSRSRNRDALLSEFTVNAGVQIFNWLRVFGGYNYMYVNHVVRPGDQIDRAVNTTQLVSFTGLPTGPLAGPPNPTHHFRDVNYWVHGLNFGLEVRY